MNDVGEQHLYVENCFCENVTQTEPHSRLGEFPRWSAFSLNNNSSSRFFQRSHELTNSCRRCFARFLLRRLVSARLLQKRSRFTHSSPSGCYGVLVRGLSFFFPPTCQLRHLVFFYHLNFFLAFFFVEFCISRCFFCHYSSFILAGCFLCFPSFFVCFQTSASSLLLQKKKKNNRSLSGFIRTCLCRFRVLLKRG